MRIEVLIPHTDLRRIVSDYLVKRGVTMNILAINYNFEAEQLVLEVDGEPLPEKPAVSLAPIKMPPPEYPPLRRVV